jgi:uncharacterized membrane protein YedE/YeeE
MYEAPGFWPWWQGGVAIGVITLLLLWLGNQRLGLSTGFENLCALVLRTPHLQRAEVSGSAHWRLPFLAGLVLGGALAALATGQLAPSLAVGMLDARFAPGPGAKLAWMFTGGLLIGFGTRLSNGCTSGHGIFGLSNFERGSLDATLAFLAAGMLTTFLVYGGS